MLHSVKHSFSTLLGEINLVQFLGGHLSVLNLNVIFFLFLSFAILIFIYWWIFREGRQIDCLVAVIMVEKSSTMHLCRMLQELNFLQSAAIGAKMLHVKLLRISKLLNWISDSAFVHEGIIEGGKGAYNSILMHLIGKIILMHHAFTRANSQKLIFNVSNCRCCYQVALHFPWLHNNLVFGEWLALIITIKGNWIC